MNTIINKLSHIKLGLILFSLLAFSACQEDVLNLTPYSSISELSAFENPDLIALSVTGVYDAAQSGFYQASQGAAFQVRGYPFGAASIEQGDCRGEDMLNMATFYQITYNSIYDPTTAQCEPLELPFGRDHKANNVIEGVKGAGTRHYPFCKGREYEGEMRFLRHWLIMELLIFCLSVQAYSLCSTGFAFRKTPMVGSKEVEARKISKAG